MSRRRRVGSGWCFCDSRCGSRRVRRCRCRGIRGSRRRCRSGYGHCISGDGYDHIGDDKDSATELHPNPDLILIAIGQWHRNCIVSYLLPNVINSEVALIFLAITRLAKGYTRPVILPPICRRFLAPLYGHVLEIRVLRNYRPLGIELLVSGRNAQFDSGGKSGCLRLGCFDESVQPSHSRPCDQ